MARLRLVLKTVLAYFILWSGIALASRLLLWRDRVLILLYHDPRPEVLDRHLHYLTRIADLISLANLWQPPRLRRRPRALITLDDGHLGNAKLLDVFLKYEVRPTIYICSQIVNTNRQFWWMHPAARTEGIQRLKRLSNRERLLLLGAHGFRQDAEAEQQVALSVQDIAALKRWVDFQSHGRFHPILTQCDDAECQFEISESRREIEALVGSKCVHFAYPNGNYREREITMLKADGYSSARSLDLGWNDENVDPFRLKALTIDDNCSVSRFAAELSLLPRFLSFLSQGSFRGRAPQN